MKKAIVLALALAALCSGAAWAQVGGVVGVVVDREGAPVENARVSLHQDDVCVAYVFSDASGAFTFENVAPGVYDVKASVKKTGTATVTGVQVEADVVTDVGTLQLAGTYTRTRESSGPRYGEPEPKHGDR